MPPRQRALPVSDDLVAICACAAITLALLVYGALNWGGQLPGNDDMMRLAQVRDLMAGQGWLDVDQSRFISQEGGAMHWSRIPDIFIAGLVLLFSLFMAPDAAEHAALLVWPRLLLLAALTGLVICVRRLGGGWIGAGFAALCFLVSHAMVQFQPGRIDHHGLELVLVIWGLAELLDPHARARSGVLLGGCIAGMVAVAIESLPYAAILAASAAFLWWKEPNLRRRQTMALGASILVCAGVFYVLDAPGMASRGVCDAYGSFHAAALGTGGAGLLALAGVFSLSGSARQRLSGVGLVGGAAFAAAMVTNPACLGSPYGVVDSAVMTDWMASVTEARGIAAVFDTNPAFGIYVFGFAGLALLGAVLVTLSGAGPARNGRYVMLALLSAALLVTAWQVRAVVFSHGLAAIAAGLVAAWLYDRARSQDGSARILAVAGLLALAPTTWQAIGSAAAPERDRAPSAWAAACFAPGAFAPLASEPKGAVFAPIDLGTALLIRSPHDIYAAPYHRNQSAILSAMNVFTAAPGDARTALADAGADYLHVCPQMGELSVYAARAPDGLAVQLRAGTAPDWLVPVFVSEDVATYRIAD